jgi:hypothetical protein
MITILAVGEDAAQLAAFGAGHPSVEIVASTGAEDALDRLARNRRIDAVLILEEDPGAPPLYVLAGCRSEPSGTTRLSAFNGPDAADELLRALSRP